MTGLCRLCLFADAGTVGLHDGATLTSENSLPGTSSQRFVNSFPLLFGFIMPHRYAKYQMRPVVKDVLWSVYVSHNHEVSCANSKLIEVKFGSWTRMGPSSHVLGAPDPPRERPIRWRSVGPL